MRSVRAQTGRTILLAALCAGAANAADNFQASLEAGDEQSRYRNSDLAIREYEAALAQASDNTERALAMAKKASVLAFQQKNYIGARQLAEEALKRPDVRPVARVTALQVLAECQMKADQDFKKAANTLEKALQLPEVEWARPSTLIALGDCYRLSGRFHEALKKQRQILDLPASDDGVKAVAHLNMGFTYQYGLKDYRKAREAYAKAVELNPALESEVAGHLSALP